MSYTLGQELYKIDSKGKTRIWKIDVVDSGYCATIITTAGLQSGKQVVNTVDIFEGKNTGKTNFTTYYTQAVSEAMATAELKLRGEYRTDLANVEHQTLRGGIKSPMLAQKYHPTGAQSSSKTLTKMGLGGKPIHVQPKIDGNRCLVKIEPALDGKGLVAVMHTRKGDVMPVQLGHILQSAITSTENLFEGSTSDENTPEITLDGELFSDEMSFNELNGHLKRKDSKDPAQLAKIKYHLYDVMVNKPYNERYEMIQQFEFEFIKVIPSFEIKATDETIQQFLEKFLDEGHEGLMIRRLDMPYENKRSWQLMKCKIFEDKEFRINDLHPDVMGRLGRIECDMDCEAYDRDGKLIRFVYPGIAGVTHDEGRRMLEEKHKYIGKQATIEFFGRSEFLVPRFPKFKGVRE